MYITVSNVDKWPLLIKCIAVVYNFHYIIKFIFSVFKSPRLLVSHILISLALSPGNSPFIYVLLKRDALSFISTFFFME